MKNIFYKITARTMGLNRTRTIVTILGVILSAAMLTAVAVFGISVLNYIETKTVEKEGSWHVAAEGFTEKELQEIRKDKRIKSLSIQREIGYLRGSEADGDYIRIFSRDNSAWKNLPLEIEKGRIPENEREILIPYEGIELEGKKASVGDTVTLKSGQFFMDGRHMVSDQAASLSADGEEEAAEGAENSSVSFQENESGTYQVVGVYHDVQQARAASGFFGYMLIAGPYGTLPEHSYCDVYIEMKNPKDADAFIEDWLEGKEYGSYVSWNRHDSLLRWQGVFRNNRYTYMIGGVLGTLLAVIMAGSVLLIYNSFSISLRERTVQFGLLASVGATKKQLRRSLRFEAFVVSAVGIPLGLLAGAAGSAVTLHFIGAGLTSFIYGEKGTVEMSCSPAVLAGSAVLAFLTVLLSVWIPAARAGKVSPMEAVRSLQDIRIRPREVKSAKLTGRLFGLEGMLAGKNYRRDRKKYRSTVISLTMSIVLFVTASLFFLYMEEAGSTILNPPSYELQYQKILGWNESEDDKNALIRTKAMLDEEELVDSYESYKEFSILIPMRQEDVSEAYRSENYWEELADGSIPFHCSAVVLQDKDYETYLKEQRLEKPKSGSGVIYAIYYDQVQSYNEETQSYDKVPALTENVKRRALGAGRVLHRKDEKEKTGDAGEYEQLFQVELAQEARELPLQCGTENVFKPVLILSEEQAKQYAEYIDQPVKEGWEAEEELYIAYFQIHAENYIEAAENLEEEIQNMPEEQQGSLYTPAEDAAMSRQAVTAIRVLCYGFIVLLSMIAVANVFNTISTNLMLRRKEFAMLRSVGMTGKGFRKMMLYECLVYGTRSVLYGCILSSAVSILFWKFTSQASGQELIFPWSYFLTAAAGVLAIVLVTMIYTMRKIRKFNIIDELRMA